MEILDFIVKTKSGKNTNLDKAYFKLLNNVMSLNDEEKEERWENYNLIIKDLLNIDNGQYFEEIKYRLTDNEDPNEVILDIISRYAENELTHLIWTLRKRIEEYKEEDFFKRFY